jgi:hypothetical protein
MYATFIVSTPEGWGYLKYINRRNLILYKTYVHKATPHDLENIPIQIYHYFCTMSPTDVNSNTTTSTANEIYTPYNR